MCNLVPQGSKIAHSLQNREARRRRADGVQVDQPHQVDERRVAGECADRHGAEGAGAGEQDPDQLGAGEQGGAVQSLAGQTAGTRLLDAEVGTEVAEELAGVAVPVGPGRGRRKAHRRHRHRPASGHLAPPHGPGRRQQVIDLDQGDVSRHPNRDRRVPGGGAGGPHRRCAGGVDEPAGGQHQPLADEIAGADPARGGAGGVHLHDPRPLDAHGRVRARSAGRRRRS